MGWYQVSGKSKRRDSNCWRSEIVWNSTPLHNLGGTVLRFRSSTSFDLQKYTRLQVTENPTNSGLNKGLSHIMKTPKQPWDNVTVQHAVRDQRSFCISYLPCLVDFCPHACHLRVTHCLLWPQGTTPASQGEEQRRAKCYTHQVHWC